MKRRLSIRLMAAALQSADRAAKERMGMKRWLSIRLMAAALLAIEAPAVAQSLDPAARQALRAELDAFFDQYYAWYSAGAADEVASHAYNVPYVLGDGRALGTRTRSVGGSPRPGRASTLRSMRGRTCPTATSASSAPARRSSAAGACAVTGTAVCWASTAGPTRSSRPVTAGASSRSSGTIRHSPCGARSGNRNGAPPTTIRVAAPPGRATRALARVRSRAARFERRGPRGHCLKRRGGRAVRPALPLEDEVARDADAVGHVDAEVVGGERYGPPNARPDAP